MRLCLDRQIRWHFFAYRHKDFDLSHFLLNVPVDIPIILKEEYPVRSTESLVPMQFWTELQIALSIGKHSRFTWNLWPFSVILDILVSRGQKKAPQLPSLHHSSNLMSSSSKPIRSHTERLVLLSIPIFQCHPACLVSLAFPINSKITESKQTLTAKRYSSHFYTLYLLVLWNTLATTQRILLRLFFPESRLGFMPHWSKKYSHDAKGDVVSR